MTPPAHVSAEQVADLLEGILATVEADRVRSHLDGCPECRDLRAALLDVTAALAAEGSTIEPMPPAVAAALQEALMSGSVPAGPAADPPADLAAARSRRHPSLVQLSWLARAAAAVLIVAVGVAGWRALPHHGTTNAAPDAQSAMNDAAPSSGIVGGTRSGNGTPLPDGALTPSPPPAKQGPVLSLAPQEVAAAARRLAVGSVPAAGRAVTAFGCASPAAPGPATVVRWDGRRAVLAADTGTRTAQVLDCRTATHVLFTVAY